MTISMTKITSAEYPLSTAREPLQADGAISDMDAPNAIAGPNPASYYTAEGNPPGRWIGSASRLLGGEPGQEAGADTVRMLINERRNPVDGKLLGESDMQAGDGGEAPNAGFDLTQTVPKSVAVIWAFADPETRRIIEECLHEAATMTMEYFEREYASTRAGQGGVASVRCDGVAGFAFDHYDSRDGDPHPHTHLFISNRVRRTSDGQWTALDGRKVYAASVELSEYNSNIIRDLLTERLGFSWREKENTNGTKAIGLEVEGVPQELIDLFSGRHQEIAHEVDRRVTEEELRLGRPVDWRRRAEIDKQVWLETRKSKPEIQPSLAEKRRHWKAKLAIEAPDQSIRAMMDAVRAHHGETLAPAEAAMRAAGIRLAGQLAERQAPQGDMERLARTAYENMTRTRASWTRSNIRAEAQRLLADVRMDPARRAETANRIADLAIGHCVSITPTRYRVAETLRDPALVMEPGRSVLDDPNLDRYTSRETLAAEAHVMSMFDHADPLAWRQGTARAILERQQDPARPLSGDQMTAAIHLLENPRQASALIGPAGTGKTTTMRAVADAWRSNGGQVIGLALSARARDELADSIGNACTIAHLLANNNNDAIARGNAIRRSLACRLAAAATPHERDRIRRGITSFDMQDQTARIHAGDLVIVDEAGMVGTRNLEQVSRLVEQAGARLLLVGDPKQLSAPDGPGGILAWADREGRGVMLTSIWRFRHDPELWRNDPKGDACRWENEAQATLRLREGGDRAKPGSIAACNRLIGEYDDHHRIHWGEDDECEQEAYLDTIRWQKQGKTTLLIAGTNEQVRDLNRRTILERRAQGLSDGDPDRLATLSDGLTVGRGDQIVARMPDSTIKGPDGRKIENGRNYTIESVERRTLTCIDTDGGRWTIPREWANQHCEAGYAATIHRAQGMTVDRCAVVVSSTARTMCELLYVALTRGREENHAYWACKSLEERRTDHDLYGTDTDPAKLARTRMLTALTTHADTRTATETMHDEQEERHSLPRLIRERQYLGGYIAQDHLLDSLRRHHNNGEMRMIQTSPSFEWLRATWSRAYMTDPKRALAILSRPINPRRLSAGHPTMEQATPYAIRTARKHMPRPGTPDKGETMIHVHADRLDPKAKAMGDRLARLGVPHDIGEPDVKGMVAIRFDKTYAPAVDALIGTYIDNKAMSQTAIPDWKEFDRTTKHENGRPIGTPRVPAGRVDYAAVIAGRLNNGMLDRVNGVIHDQWTAGVIPPIRSSTHPHALDLIRQSDRLIEREAERLTGQARASTQPWAIQARQVADIRNDPTLLRDIAVYRAMWGVTDRTQPIGQRPPTSSGRQEQHWCNIDARLTGQGAGVANPPKRAKNRQTTAPLRVDMQNHPAPGQGPRPDTIRQERRTQWNMQQEPSPNSSYDGPSV